MRKFEEPTFEVITLASTDVVTTSGEFLDINNSGYIPNNTNYGDVLGGLLG